jgi:hypothetical protein
MIMYLRIVLMTAVVTLAGCGSATRVDDRFVRAAPAAHETQIAEDAVRQLVSLYPPASTHLLLARPARDTFGAQLVEKLRTRGYAMQEPAAQASLPANGAAADAASSTAGTSFDYLIDSITSPRLYRITLKVGRQVISRAYIPQDDLVHPAGAWVRKE